MSKPRRCKAVKRDGTRGWCWAMRDSDYCHVHQCQDPRWHKAEREAKALALAVSVAINEADLNREQEVTVRRAIARELHAFAAA